MKDIYKYTDNYFINCRTKNLNPATIKAYRIDLTQFIAFAKIHQFPFERSCINDFAAELIKKYKPRTVKRKMASIHSFYYFLECEEIIKKNPFNTLKVRIKEPIILPKTITIGNLNILFNKLYSELSFSTKNSYKKVLIRDIAILELLFATGMRISELCHLTYLDLNLQNNTVTVLGKGNKERIIQLTNHSVLKALNVYIYSSTHQSNYLFTNRLNNRLSEQSVRFMIKKYTAMAGIKEHITPHMFRHTFATALLDADVDIRIIQEILGHKSILTTQIYASVSMQKQKQVFLASHPRNNLIIHE